MNTINDRPVSLQELRKERLIAACIEDRRKLHRLFTPPPPPEEPEYDDGAPNWIQDVLKFTAAIPGPIGRWSRRLSWGTNLWKVISGFAHKSR